MALNRIRKSRLFAYTAMVRTAVVWFGLLLALIVSFAPFQPVYAACGESISITSTTPYTQDFNTLATAGTTNPIALTGWCINERGANANQQYQAGAGSNTAGDTYSFGINTDRALGSIHSSSLTSIFGVQFVNNTGSAITSLAVQYRGEAWRLGRRARTDRLDFQYQINATSGTWTDVDTLDFTTPNTSGRTGPRDGNAVGLNTNLSGSIPVTIEAGDTFFVRWQDFNPSGADDGLAVDDFQLQVTTSGGTASTDLAACGTSATLISAIQGSSATTPISGNTTTLEGVVTGDFQGAGGLSGFFVQEEHAQADGNAQTSEGIFISDGAGTVAVAVGDLVRVTGIVGEQPLAYVGGTTTRTQITAVTQVLMCSSGNTLPTAVTFDLPLNDAARETFEGMRVTVPDTLTVIETFELGRYGQPILSASGRQYQYTQTNAPSVAGSSAYLATSFQNRIALDDGNFNQNPDPILYPSPGLSATNTLRSGYTTSNLVGILDQRTTSSSADQPYEVYRIHPDPAALPTFAPANPRPESPSVEGRIQVATFNVLNYFTTLGANSNLVRGATNAAEFDRQRAKIFSAFLALDAEVYGLVEIENSNGNVAIQDFVDGLNAIAGTETFNYVDTGVLGGDAIRVAFVYQVGVVEPVGDFAALDDVFPFEMNTRPPLAQLFREVATSEQFIAIVNHFKSKSCSGASGANADQGDGQGCFNSDRLAAANALLNWIDGDAYFDQDPDVLIIGDLNAYAQEQPVTTLTGAGFTNLTAGAVYSYVFDGFNGVLDHGLVNAALFPQVAGYTEWHINADEPTALDYNLEFKSPDQQTSLYSPGPYRSSDHDPLLIGLDLSSPCADNATG